MSAAFQVPKGRLNVGNGKNTVHLRAHTMQANGSVHVLEHGAAADENALNADRLHEDRHGVHLAGGAREDPDQADMAAAANGPKGLAKRAGAADLDNVIHTM